MVAGLIIQVVCFALGVVVVFFVCSHLYTKGFVAGARSEAQGWLDAINKIIPPNWQSLPDVPDVDPEQSKEVRKLYVNTFKFALDIIKEEIAMNRIAAIATDVAKASLADDRGSVSQRGGA